MEEPTAIPMKSLLTEAINRIAESFQSSDAPSGLATGFVELDKRILGLHSSELIVIGGRPSMGKMTLAINIAVNASNEDSPPTLIFSLEMTRQQVAERMIASTSGITLTDICTGKLQGSDWSLMTKGVTRLADLPIFVDDSPQLSLHDITARSTRLHTEHGGLALIIVGSVQTLNQVDAAGPNRDESDVLKSLKTLAVTLNVPVLVLSDLDHRLEERADKRPTITDLRAFTEVDRYADLIAFVYRDEVYNDASRHKSQAEIIIAKNKRGPIGTAFLQFRGQFSRFENLPGRHRVVVDFCPPTTKQ